MAILAPDLDRILHLAIDKAVAVAVLREMAIGALHPLFGVNVHQMDRLAGIDPDGDELALALAAEFLGIVGPDDLALGIEQIARAIALEHRAEIPAVAVVIGELRVLRPGVQIIDVAQEIRVRPIAARVRALGVALQCGMGFGGGGIFLLRGPHQRRIRLIIPHRIAEIAVQEDVGLVHVAGHAL